MGLLDTIKQVAIRTNEAYVPTAFLFGGVTGTNPLTIRIDNRFDISGNAIVLTTGYDKGLSVGDKLVLLRNQGGQTFLVLGKV